MTQQCPPDDQSDAATASTTAAHPLSQPSFTPWLTPGTALLISGLPLGLGAYMGYRRALHSSSPSSSSTSSKSILKGNSILGQIIHPEPPIGQNNAATNHPSIPSTSAGRIITSTTPPPILAARALVLGSLLSLSATSLLISGIFFASGCHSVEDLMSTWRSWAPNKLRGFENSLENVLGISVGTERRNAKMEYEQAIKGMTEEEELDYVKNKYGEEIQWDLEDE
ncbi:hypothetical protein ACHAXR_002495 [Thalassiosira sp. AJA248-18]